MEYEHNGYRAGTGWDIHKLVEGRQLVLGGVVIPAEKGCEGHSDGDAVTHAVIDALLGAAGLPDIGTQFPDTDPSLEGISSMVLLDRTYDMFCESYRVLNVDVTVVLQEPKLGQYKETMSHNIARMLDIPSENVSIKAKTAEHMLGELGTGDAVMAMAAVMLRKYDTSSRSSDGQSEHHHHDHKGKKHDK